MASEIEIRKKVQAGAGDRKKQREKFAADKQARRKASQVSRNKKRLKDAQARLNALMNPKSAKDKKDSKANLGEIRRLKALIAELKKRLNIKDTDKSTGSPIAPERGKGVDSAGPEGEKARKKPDKEEKTDDNKNKSGDNRKTAPESKDTKKSKGPSKGSIMGGKNPKQGPLGSSLEKQKKKKKKSMMGTNRFGAKNNYGLDRRTGNYYGQR